jgi:hypothetical protein
MPGLSSKRVGVVGSDVIISIQLQPSPSALSFTASDTGAEKYRAVVSSAGGPVPVLHGLPHQQLRFGAHQRRGDYGRPLRTRPAIAVAHVLQASRLEGAGPTQLRQCGHPKRPAGARPDPTARGAEEARRAGAQVLFHPLSCHLSDRNTMSLARVAWMAVLLFWRNMMTAPCVQMLAYYCARRGAGGGCNIPFAGLSEPSQRK